jgi:hypothetical protein
MTMGPKQPVRVPIELCPNKKNPARMPFPCTVVPSQGMIYRHIHPLLAIAGWFDKRTWRSSGP